MKAVITVLLVTLLLSFALPALAQDAGHTCPHSGTTITDLRACVTHAATMGHISNGGIAKSLLSKLDVAQATLDRGQPAVAVNILNAFIHAVEAQTGKHIDEHHAGHMVEHAGQVIDALS